MPTPGGLPRAGEVWELSWRSPPEWKREVTRVTIIERGRGEYWSLRVRGPGGVERLWVDASYYFSQGNLKFIER